MGDQPGALPLLQYALTELYERRVSELLTRDAYRELGGVAGALARRADELTDEASAAERAALPPAVRPPRRARRGHRGHPAPGAWSPSWATTTPPGR